MSDKVTNPLATPSFSFNRTICEQKIVQVKEYMQKFVGKVGYNPHMWIAKNLTPIKVRLEKGETTKELQDAFAALTCQEPIAAKHNLIDPPKQPQSAGGETITMPQSKIINTNL